MTNHLVSKQFRMSEYAADPAQDQSVTAKAIQTPRQGTFGSTSLTVKRNALKYLKCPQSSYCKMLFVQV